MANNATVVDSDKVRTDDGQEHSGLAKEIETLGAVKDDRVEWIETEQGQRLVISGD
jgi:hypothetical protein